MNEMMLKDLLATVERLKKKADVRAGVVTAVDPLAVSIGGAAVPYTNVAVAGGSDFTVGDRVRVLTWDGDMLVLGAVSAAAGGADPTGTIDSTAALSAMSEIPAGTYRVDGVIQIPYGRSFYGKAGAGATRLVLGAGGQIRLGYPTSGPTETQTGGRYGGFMIDGADVANVSGGGLWIGNLAYAEFEDLKVLNCAGDGVTFEGAQNCRGKLFTANHGGHCLIFDYGAGGNDLHVEAALPGPGKYAVVFRQSGAATYASQYPQAFGPCDNKIRGLIEFTEPAADPAGLIYHGAGRFNQIYAGVGTGTLDTATPVVVMNIDAGVSVSELAFIDTLIQGTDEQATLFQLGAFCQLGLIGHCRLYTAEVAFRTRATSVLRMDPRTEIAFVDTLWQQVAGDTPTTTFASLLTTGDFPQRGVRVIGETGEASAFGTAWTSYGGGYLPARYYRDSAGVVHAEGYVKNTVAKTASSTIFGFPAGFWPPANVIASATMGATNIGQVVAQPDGQVAWFHLGTDLPINSFTGIAMSFMAA